MTDHPFISLVILMLSIAIGLQGFVIGRLINKIENIEFSVKLHRKYHDAQIEPMLLVNHNRIKSVMKELRME
jgi:hypothetical protein